MRRVVVAATDGSIDTARELAVRLRDEGAEVIWQGRAALSHMVAAAVQEAADELHVVGAGSDDARGRLAAMGAPEIAVRGHESAESPDGAAAKV